MQIALLLALGLLAPGFAHAATADDCTSFAVQVAAAEHAYADYNAYLKNDDADDAGISYKVFSHLLDVADEYSQGCDVASHKDAFKAYTTLDWYRQEHIYFTYTSGVSEGKRDAARAQSNDLKLLWALGFATSDGTTYSVMKSTTESHFKELGLSFVSPETGRVIVKGNQAVADCEKNDHPAGYTGVTLAYPEDAAKAKLGGSFDLDVLVDSSGNAKTASATIDGNMPDDPGATALLLNVGRELAMEAQDVKWTPAVVACRPMTQDYLMLKATLDPATGSVTLEPWKETQQ